MTDIINYQTVLQMTNFLLFNGDGYTVYTHI